MFILDDEVMKIIKNLIENNIFLDYKQIHYKFLSIHLLHSYDIYIILNDYTGKKFNSNINKKINIDDLVYQIKNFYNNLYDKLNYYYYSILQLNNNNDIVSYIENNIIEYCNVVGLKIESPKTILDKNNIFNDFDFSKRKILCICNNTNNPFTIYCKNKNKKIDYTISKINYDIIYIVIYHNTIDEIFSEIIKHFFILNKNGIIIIENSNDNFDNFDNAIIYFIEIYKNKINKYNTNTNYFNIFTKL